MIKINLLPTTKKGKRFRWKVSEFQRQLILGTIILGIVAFLLLSYWTSLTLKISNLQKTKAANEAKLEEQKKTLKEVEKVKDQRAEVNSKIAIIEKLKKSQRSLVRLLDELSKALPPGVNFTTLTDTSVPGGIEQVNLEGTAFTNNDIVRFVGNLNKPPSHFSAVFLQETAQITLEGTEVYKYKLQFTFKGE